MSGDSVPSTPSRGGSWSAAEPRSFYGVGGARVPLRGEVFEAWRCRQNRRGVRAMATSSEDAGMVAKIRKDAGRPQALPAPYEKAHLTTPRNH